MPRRYWIFLAMILAAAAAGWHAARPWLAPAGALASDEAVPPGTPRIINGNISLSSQAVGHQYREDDWPAIAAAPDGSVWIAWLSFNGEHDDVALRHYQGGRWHTLHWVPNTSGDSWMPQVAVDASNRAWVVWTQQLDGNWDLYARRFDPARQEWGRQVRLTSDPAPTSIHVWFPMARGNSPWSGKVSAASTAAFSSRRSTASAGPKRFR